MFRWILPLLLILSPALSAQTHIAAGVSGGLQSYANEEDDPRVLAGGEALVQRGRFAIHAAFEYADLSSGGALIAVHPDLAFVSNFADRWTFLAGAGPTIINIESLSDDRTWNVELELARRFTHADVFARVRHYDYEAEGFRAFASPSGPVVSIGARFQIH
ncbi:MAG TPA: hypothetical protein VHW00_10255 [Thermoanaerobaculia bacterium]|nr:hypothetical protein [Thermoanaerobaculia bacterium]